MSRFNARDDLRSQLDALMGVARDEEGREVSEPKHFWEKEVCKNYLGKLCPHDLFGNTKQDLGPCPGLHKDRFVEEYEKVKEKLDFGYESDLLRNLEGLVADNDRKIERETQRLAREQGEGDEVSKKEAELSEEIGEMLAKVEQLAEEGKVEESMALMEKAEKMKTVSMEEMKQETAAAGGGGGEAEVLIVGNLRTRTQKLHVCSTCGAYLSSFDTDQSLAIHFAGKQHLGYLAIRKKVEELKEFLATPRVRVRIGEEERIIRKLENGESLEPGEIFEKERDKDKDRYRDRDRGYSDRDRDRDRRRGDYHRRGRYNDYRSRDRRDRSRERKNYRDDSPDYKRRRF